METLQEKIISLELTKPDDLNLENIVVVNGTTSDPKNIDCDEESQSGVSEPPTPTSNEGKTLLEGELTTVNCKKKKRKRSKKGTKH